MKGVAATMMRRPSIHHPATCRGKGRGYEASENRIGKKRELLQKGSPDKAERVGSKGGPNNPLWKREKLKLEGMGRNLSNLFVLIELRTSCSG